MTECPYEVYIVANRPYAEKCIGAVMNNECTDGVFWCDKESAVAAAKGLEHEFGPGVWKVYRAHITVIKEEIPIDE